MRRALLLSSTILLAVAAATVAFERDAEACGGCFLGENPSVVTDHRMVLSIAKDQTTLYDQIRYQGDPGSFAWVLPIAGTVDVGLSSDTLFNILDQQTQTRIQPPPQNCPQPPDGCYDNRGGFAAPSAASGGGEDAGGVDVLKRETVGPYETVQLQSTDPTALESWLTKNGFKISDPIKPVIAAYVAGKYNFLALKLVPGKGVQDMRPVRVTTQGATAVLPLRMVAAGAGASVGITLWVVGEGRYEPQNFPDFYIKTDEITWSWAQSKSNYTDLRAQKTTAGGGRIWELESSSSVYPSNISSQLMYSTGYPTYLPDGGTTPPPGGYTPITDEQGNVLMTADQARQADVSTLFHGLPQQSARVTRLRADLAYQALDADLVMTASQDQTELPTFRQLTRESDQPICPVYSGCEQTGTAPRDQAIAQTASNGGGSACATAPTRNGQGWLAAGAGFAGLALVNAFRRRRAR